MEFNFEEKSFGKICNFTEEQISNLSHRMSNLGQDIETNIEPYLFNGTDDEGRERQGVHRGKVLKFYFDAITDPQERAVVMFSFDHIISKLTRRIEHRQFGEGLSGILAELFGKQKPFQ